MRIVAERVKDIIMSSSGYAVASTKCELPWVPPVRRRNKNLFSDLRYDFQLSWLVIAARKSHSNNWPAIQIKRLSTMCELELGTWNGCERAWLWPYTAICNGEWAHCCEAANCFAQRVFLLKIENFPIIFRECKRFRVECFCFSCFCGAKKNDFVGELLRPVNNRFSPCNYEMS